MLTPRPLPSRRTLWDGRVRGSMCVGKCRHQLPTLKRQLLQSTDNHAWNEHVVSSTSCLLCHSNHSALRCHNRAGLRSSMPRSNAGFPTHTSNQQQPPHGPLRSLGTRHLVAHHWWQEYQPWPAAPTPAPCTSSACTPLCPCAIPMLAGRGGSRSTAVRDISQHHTTHPHADLTGFVDAAGSLFLLMQQSNEQPQVRSCGKRARAGNKEALATYSMPQSWEHAADRHRVPTTMWL